jgi:chemotaxis protein MotB
VEDKKKTIIIKRVKKGHGGGHGGSWKVAYADFVTAMMAFFLLMWLLAMVSPEKKAVMSLYFKEFSLFEKGGKSFMQEGGLKPLFESPGQQGAETQDVTKDADLGGKEVKAGALLAQVEQRMKTAKEDFKGSILVDTSENGVRIQIVDRKEVPIFLAGSPQLTEEGKRIARFVASSMRGLPNDIVVEGHTDASGGTSDQSLNWELSALRACNAKRELEASGMELGKIARVVGYAQTMLLIKDDPEDPRNRRVSIIFLHQKKSKTGTPYDWVWKGPPSEK